MNKSESIPCLVDHESRAEIMDYAASKLKLNDICVELGSYLGGSVIRLAKSLQKANTVCEIYAIDNWLCQNISLESLLWSKLKKHSEVLEQFQTNLQQHNLEDIIKVLVKDTVIAAECFLDKELNYLFMDASHDYGGLKKELEVWLPKVSDRALVAVHDWPDHNIQKAIREVFGEPLRITTGGSSAILIDTL